MRNPCQSRIIWGFALLNPRHPSDSVLTTKDTKSTKKSEDKSLNAFVLFVSFAVILPRLQAEQDGPEIHLWVAKQQDACLAAISVHNLC